MKRFLSALFSTALCVSPALAELVQEEVPYELPGGGSAIGLLVYDNEFGVPDGSGPGVLVIPEWWGTTAFATEQAERMALAGRVAFVADMYGDRQTTDDPAEAGRLSGAARETGLASLATAGLEAFAGTGHVAPHRIAAIGFCFGGSTVADLVRTGANIAGAVSFHGGLSAEAAPAEAGEGFPPLLVLHGGADPLVSPESLGGFVTASLAAGVPLSLVSYPGVKHAFTNPAADGYGMAAVAYDAAAAEDSFATSEAFLAYVLGE